MSVVVAARASEPQRVTGNDADSFRAATTSSLLLVLDDLRMLLFIHPPIILFIYLFLNEISHILSLCWPVFFPYLG